MADATWSLDLLMIFPPGLHRRPSFLPLPPLYTKSDLPFLISIPSPPTRRLPFLECPLMGIRDKKRWVYIDVCVVEKEEKRESETES